MTSQSPRIYTYKITFEEVPYYYYGVKKEKYFNQEYWGSPKTNKWCWELYTPKKQILEIFDYNDEGWLKALGVEKRLIKPVYNTDKWCLNESCGGKISLEHLIKGGKKAGTKVKELSLGVHALTPEQHSKNGKKGGGKGGTKTKELSMGIFGRTPEQITEDAKKGAKKTNAQKWICLETGFITNPGNLTKYQKARKIDTSKRIRIL